MRSTLKRRLEVLENQIETDEQRMLVFTDKSDSPGAVEDKIERWKAGEEVEGIRGGSYSGSNLMPMVVTFVSAKKAKDEL